MRYRLFLLPSILCALGCASQPQTADVVLHNGAIYTMNPAQPEASAIAIDAGRIVAVGDAPAVTRKFRGRVDIDLKGQMVLPGFHDSHAHPLQGGIALAACELSEMETIEAIVAKVTACDKTKPAGEWLVGSGWNLSLFPQANPNKTLLDAISTVRPILLEGADGHSSWANSKALALAGIERTTPNPPNGIIERDAHGEPTGTLRESAQALVGDLVPSATAQTRRDGLLRGLQVANGFGITSFVDAWVNADELATYRDMERSGALTARVVASVDSTQPGVYSLARPQDRGTGARVRADSAKIFVDGVLEGETAALLQPYLDHPETRGDLKMSPEELATQVTELDRRGIQVHMHAIGDRAVRTALDAVAAARSANGPGDNRHHIAHLQLIDPLDRPRFAQLGVIANFQPLWAFPDQYITDVNLPQVGQARVDQMYPIHSTLAAGARIAGGSDWPVESMNPLLAMHVALTRSGPMGQRKGVLNAAERVTLDEILAAYTIGGAYLMHAEHETGSLEVGKAADVVVLERDLFKIPVDQIGGVAVTRTLFNGVTVFSR